jgi:GNAT superfamily N-acetyltransferase
MRLSIIIIRKPDRKITMPTIIHTRKATRSDVPAIVRMLADDILGSQREDLSEPLPPAYYTAFEQITRDSNHEQLVAELDGEVVGTLHLIFLPSISYCGGLRAQIESVRVASKYRSRGIGAQMVEHAIQRAQERGAHVAQLTTEKSRVDAHRFYERLGFASNHIGMKRKLK